jgi:hypothetical protein
LLIGVRGEMDDGTSNKANSLAKKSKTVKKRCTESRMGHDFSNEDAIILKEGIFRDNSMTEE